MLTTSSSNSSTVCSLPDESRVRLWPAALVSGLVAAAATTSVAALADALGSQPAVGGTTIPLAAFAQLTLIAALLGVMIAKVLSSRTRHPRQLFVRITSGLALVSIVPDCVIDATIGSRLTLVLTHAVAAVVVIPALARRLAR
ncbi:MAG: hypothetical protein JWN99_1664 [Ilumatobacteraceae bacterium]|nr:hypothetical protein [Ilumatobacteraceae bacterium]